MPREQFRLILVNLSTPTPYHIFYLLGTARASLSLPQTHLDPGHVREERLGRL